MNIKNNLLSFFTIILAIGFAVGTSAFKTTNYQKIADEYFWVLSPGNYDPTPDESKYMEGSNSCNADIHFCGFYAPKDENTGEPVIQPSSSLYNDLDNLSVNPDVHYNSSGKITFRDSE